MQLEECKYCKGELYYSCLFGYSDEGLCRSCLVWYVEYYDVPNHTLWYELIIGSQYYGLENQDNTYRLYHLLKHEEGTICPDQIVYDYDMPILSFKYIDHELITLDEIKLKINKLLTFS